METTNIITVTEQAVNERVSGSKMVKQVSINTKEQVEKVVAIASDLKSDIHSADGKTIILIREMLQVVRAVDFEYILKQFKDKTHIKASLSTLRKAYKIADRLDDYALNNLPNVATVDSLTKLLNAFDTIKKEKPALLSKVIYLTENIFSKYSDEGTARINQRAEFETELLKVVNSRLKKLKSTPKTEEVAERELVKGITAGQINDVPLLMAHIKGILNNTTKGELLRDELQGLLNSMAKTALKAS